MNLSDFTYDIPSSLIAQEPIEPRHNSRLMVVNKESGQIEHKIFHQLSTILSSDDVLVVNNTKVLPVRIIASLKNGGQLELLLIKQVSNNVNHWLAMAKPLRKVKVGDKFVLFKDDEEWTITVIDIIYGQEGFKQLIIDIEDSTKLFSRLNTFGYAPLPPYIEQDLVARRLDDIANYQTIFAKNYGAIAAPTAGMHFTSELLDKLRASNVSIFEITLHVGVGTFKPIVVDELEKHDMESEIFTIPQNVADSLNIAKKNNKRIIAVGTTTARALESACVNDELNACNSATTDLYIPLNYLINILSP